MSTKKVLFIVFASNLLLLAGLFGILHLTHDAYALSLAQPPAAQMAAAGTWDHNLYPQIPAKMIYQGVLHDNSGTLLNGAYKLTFALQQCDPFCSDAWSEVHNSVPITNGLFTVVLGETTPITPSLFTAYTGWDSTWGEKGGVILVVKVNGQELSPSSEMLSVPYAFRAEYVNRFPTPDWDSGWYTMTVGGTNHTFQHDLGGNADNYIVDMQFKETGGNGVHQMFYGIDYDHNGHIWGATWRNLTNSQITVWKGNDDTYADKVRIRIWRTE